MVLTAEPTSIASVPSKDGGQVDATVTIMCASAMDKRLRLCTRYRGIIAVMMDGYGHTTLGVVSERCHPTACCGMNLGYIDIFYIVSFFVP